ncbi:MAG: hypothetical protein AB1714_25615 [Acidobacteriota bacterium]
MSTRLEIVDVSPVGHDGALVVVVVHEGSVVVGDVFEVDETKDRWRASEVTEATPNQTAEQKTGERRCLLGIERVTGEGPLDLYQILRGCDG